MTIFTGYMFVVPAPNKPIAVSEPQLKALNAPILQFGLDECYHFVVGDIPVMLHIGDEISKWWSEYGLLRSDDKILEMFPGFIPTVGADKNIPTNNYFPEKFPLRAIRWIRERKAIRLANVYLKAEQLKHKLSKAKFEDYLKEYIPEKENRHAEHT